MQQTWILRSGKLSDIYCQNPLTYFSAHLCWQHFMTGVGVA
jgi:hypothetical protein